MIKFFRHIRRALLAQNKFNKYLVYALGEIVLVVIGILIALQINNWNEQRKTDRQVQKLFKKAFKELEYNITQANILIGEYREKSPRIYDARKNRPTVATYDPKTHDIDGIMGSFFPVNISTTAFDDLFSFNANQESTDESYIETLDALYKEYAFMLNDLDEEVEIVVDDYNAFLRNNKPWYGDENEPNNRIQKIAFLLEDPIYVNWVTDYEHLINGHYGNTVGFKIKALQAYDQLSKHFGFKKDSTLIPLFTVSDTYLGTYDGKYYFELIKEQNQYHYHSQPVDSLKRSTRPVFFDSDSTAHIIGGFIRFYKDSLTFSFGSDDPATLIKTKQ